MIIWQLVAKYVDPLTGMIVEKRSRGIYCSKDKAQNEAGRFNYLVRELNGFGDYYPVEIKVQPWEMI